MCVMCGRRVGGGEGNVNKWEDDGDGDVWESQRGIDGGC